MLGPILQERKNVREEKEESRDFLVLILGLQAVHIMKKCCKVQ